MGTSYVAHGDWPRSRWLPVGLLIAGLLVVSVAAAALVPRLGTLGQGANPVSTEHVGYGSGYPLHGGLAGPSEVRAVQHFGYGLGYPLHGGLAGPSDVRAVVQHFGYGPGYPLHGGLAGPSQVEPAR